MNRLIKYIRQFFGAIEKVSDWSLVRQHSAYNSQDIKGRSLEFAVVLDNGYQAVCDNRNIDLYPNSVLGVSPEGCHSEMLLYPSEEQLNLPSLLVQQSYITSLEHKVVCQERERSLQFKSIPLFSEECPLEQTQAEVYGGGVKRIELSMQDKLPVQSLALSKIDHVVGELFKYPVVPVGIRVGNIAELDVSAAKSEMITLILDGINDTDYFPEAVAAGKLSVHHHKKLIPACEGLHILVSTVLLDDSIEDSLRQKLNELTEKIFSAIHAGLCCFQEANLRNQFKSTRAIFAYN